MREHMRRMMMALSTKPAATRRGFVFGLSGFAVLTASNLRAAFEGGAKTLVIGASRRGCEMALSDPSGVVLADRGMLPAIELGPAETDRWAKKLLDAHCRVLLNMEIANVERLASGYRVTAFGKDGIHFFEVARVVDASVGGWHEGEYR